MSPTKSLGALFAELGLALLQNGRNEEAQDALRKALAEKPDDFSVAKIHLALGRIYNALNQNTEAVKAFAEAVSLDPTLFEAAQEEIVRAQSQSSGMQVGETSWVKVRNFVTKFLSKSGTAFRDMAFNLVDRGRY